MRFASGVFSMRRAWQNPFLRWVSLVIALFVFLGSAFFLWRVFAGHHQSDTLILHYSVYLGIDEIATRSWAILFPVLWFALTAFDLLFAFAFYRTDPHVSYSLVVLAGVWGMAWMLALYYLTLVNV